MSQERLQKILARAGVASRRAAEALIAQGKVRINGRIITELGARADASRDRVEVNGERIVSEKPAFYVLNKPREVVTTLSDPEGRSTIADLLRGIPERVFPIGRLDFHTSGVLLLTNDGELAQALLHPTKGVPKTYVVKVRGHLGLKKLEMLRNGVVLDDGSRTGRSELFVIREEDATTWLQITITQGKNRQIHRMFEAIGHRVMRLSRVEFAGVSAEGLRPGEYRPLTVRELAKLDRDYRNPAGREQQNLKRAQRHLESGFEMQPEELKILNAARDLRRGAAIRRDSAVRTRDAEMRAAEADKPAFPSKRGAKVDRDAKGKRASYADKRNAFRERRAEKKVSAAIEREAMQERVAEIERGPQRGRGGRARPPVQQPAADPKRSRGARGKPPVRDFGARPPQREKQQKSRPPARHARRQNG